MMKSFRLGLFSGGFTRQTSFGITLTWLRLAFRLPSWTRASDSRPEVTRAARIAQEGADSRRRLLTPTTRILNRSTVDDLFLYRTAREPEMSRWRRCAGARS